MYRPHDQMMDHDGMVWTVHSVDVTLNVDGSMTQIVEMVGWGKRKTVIDGDAQEKPDYKLLEEHRERKP